MPLPAQGAWQNFSPRPLASLPVERHTTCAPSYRRKQLRCTTRRLAPAAAADVRTTDSKVNRGPRAPCSKSPRSAANRQRHLAPRSLRCGLCGRKPGQCASLSTGAHVSRAVGERLWTGGGAEVGGGIHGAMGEGGSAVRSGHSSCIFKDFTVCLVTNPCNIL